MTKGSCAVWWVVRTVLWASCLYLGTEERRWSSSAPGEIIPMTNFQHAGFPILQVAVLGSGPGSKQRSPNFLNPLLRDFWYMWSLKEQLLCPLGTAPVIASKLMSLSGDPTLFPSSHTPIYKA